MTAEIPARRKRGLIFAVVELGMKTGPPNVPRVVVDAAEHLGLAVAPTLTLLRCCKNYFAAIIIANGTRKCCRAEVGAGLVTSLIWPPPRVRFC